MWNTGKFGYYFDFVFVPLLLLGLLLGATFDLRFLAGFLIGWTLWTFFEYWIHRIILHKYMRRQHWLHHNAPGDYVTTPFWLTIPLHFCTAAASSALLGSVAGAGLFCGLEIGYLVYLSVHDRIHHGKHRGFGWLRRRWEHHVLHHQGAEVNFGVVLTVWDRVFGTYRDPRIAGTVRS